MADHINARLVMSSPFELRTKWMAFALQDGSTRGDVYDSILDAKRHTDEAYTLYFAFINCLGGVSATDCARFIHFHRKARDANLSQANPKDQAFPSFTQGDYLRARLN